MKKHLYANMLATVMAAALIPAAVTGCGREKKVDYSIEGMDEISQKEQLSGSGGRSGLDQFEEEEAWEETWDVKTGESEWYGQIFSALTDVHVNARVSVPPLKEMSVIEVTAPVFDAGYKETLAKNIFDSGEIYYGDIGRLPGKELERLKNKELTEEQRELLKNIDIKKAPDTYTAVNKYDVNDYIGRFAGYLYQLSFVEEEGERCLLRQIILEPLDLKEVCPETEQSWEQPVCVPWIFGDYAENECQMSEEEALKEALRFVQGLGLEYPVMSHVCPLVWSDGDGITSFTDGGESGTWSVNGYAFSFDLGMDDFSFVDFGVEMDYTHPWYYGSEDAWLNLDIREKTQCSLNARLELFVTDRGVVCMTANNPQNITDVFEGVNLLSLDTIKGIIKDELEKKWKTFRFSQTAKYFDSMELIYFRIQDQENPEKYSYVPAWRLAMVTRDTTTHKISIRNPIFINAIDGSLIDYFNELYHMPPIEEASEEVLQEE